jgi:hypothetical protein
MSGAMKVEYRLSTAGMIVGGFLALSLGGAALTYDFLWGALIGYIGVCVGIGGVALTIIGIVRAVRERRERETPRS